MVSQCRRKATLGHKNNKEYNNKDMSIRLGFITGGGEFKNILIIQYNFLWNQSYPHTFCLSY